MNEVDYEFVFVNDGSSDKTLEIMKKAPRWRRPLSVCGVLEKLWKGGRNVCGIS